MNYKCYNFNPIHYFFFSLIHGNEKKDSSLCKYIFKFSFDFEVRYERCESPGIFIDTSELCIFIT